jgi:rRNA processing protein Gar1
LVADSVLLPVRQCYRLIKHSPNKTRNVAAGKRYAAADENTKKESRFNENSTSKTGKK